MRQREFDQYVRATDRRLDRLEARADALEAEHDTDMDRLVDSAEDRRRWTWQQIVAAVSAAAVVGALALQIVGR